MQRYHEAVEAKHAALAAVPAEDILTRDSLVGARVFYWSKDIFLAVASAARSIPLKSTLSREDAPCDSGWFWFEGLPGYRALHWHYWQRANGLGVFDISTVWFGDGAPTWHGPLSLGVDETFGSLNLEGLADGPWGLQFVLAAFAWIRGRIIVPRREPLERHARKRLMKAGVEPDAVDVIMLRKSEPRDPITHQQVDWQCWWIVRGHWTHQYYPKTKTRQLKWIVAYPKGPRDKPFKPPSDQIFAVVR